MPIITGQNIVASDFINESERNGTPSNDSNRVAKLQDDAMVHPVFMGNHLLTDGSDGDLTVSSGTTTIDLGGAQVVVKNYKDISITGSGQVAFSNPHANGTTIIFLCRKFTCTSSASPAINASGMGAAGGVGGSTSSNNTTASGTAGTRGIGLSGFQTNPGATGSLSGSASAGGALPTALTAYSEYIKSIFSGLLNFMVPGAGGGGGSVRTFNNGGNLVTAGNGGRGGGALAIICSGEWNFTSSISVAGANGTNSSGSGPEHMRGGGAGGGAGFFLGLYRRLVANAGSVTITGGTSGTGTESGSTGVTNAGGGAGASTQNAGGNSQGTSGRDGGVGATGKSSIVKNSSTI